MFYIYVWFSSYMNLLFIVHNLGITGIVLYPEIMHLDMVGACRGKVWMV